MQGALAALGVGTIPASVGLAIADIRATRRYAQTLRALGATDVVRRRPGYRFWYGNPIASTSLVSASKPSR